MSDDPIDDAETIVDKLDLVDGKDVDWTGLAQFMAASAIAFVAWGWITLFQGATSMVSHIANEYLATIGEIFWSIIGTLTKLPSEAATETIAYFDLFGPAAFPIAVVIVLISLFVIRQGVRQLG